MRQNDRVVLRRELKVTIGGGVIPEGAEGVIVAKFAGSGRNTYEVNFGRYGTAICDKDDLSVVKE